MSEISRLLIAVASEICSCITWAPAERSYTHTYTHTCTHIHTVVSSTCHHKQKGVFCICVSVSCTSQLLRSNSSPKRRGLVARPWSNNLMAEQSICKSLYIKYRRAALAPFTPQLTGFCCYVYDVIQKPSGLLYVNSLDNNGDGRTKQAARQTLRISLLCNVI